MLRVIVAVKGLFVDGLFVATIFSEATENSDFPRREPGASYSAKIEHHAIFKKVEMCLRWPK